MRVVLDTNVLIYAHDVDAGRKHEIAGNLLRTLWVQRIFGLEQPLFGLRFLLQGADMIETNTYGANRFKLAEHCVTTKPWDFLMMVEMGPDRIHHGFWKHFDETHPRHAPKGSSSSSSCSAASAAPTAARRIRGWTTSSARRRNAPDARRSTRSKSLENTKSLRLF